MLSPAARLSRKPLALSKCTEWAKRYQFDITFYFFVILPWKIWNIHIKPSWKIMLLLSSHQLLYVYILADYLSYVWFGSQLQKDKENHEFISL
jgi:hypothetical protein